MEAQDVHLRHWRFLIHDRNCFAYPEGQEDHQKDKELLGQTNRKQIVRSTTEAKVPILELGTYFYVKVVEIILQYCLWTVMI